MESQDINLQIEASQMCPSEQHRPKCECCKKKMSLKTPKWKTLCIGCYYGNLPDEPGKCLILSDSDGD